MTSQATLLPRADSTAVPLARVPRRRRWGMFAASVTLVVVGAVGAYLLVATAGLTWPYLAVTHPVAYGTEITDADLAVVYVNSGAGLAPIPADQRASVVGKRAAVDLVPGTLITAAQLTDVAIPAPGQQVVGIQLKPAQLPVRSLRPGDTVRLIVVPANTVISTDDERSPGRPLPNIAATIAGAAPADNGGNVRVDVAVAASDGPTVATMAAAGRIAVVLTTRS